MPGDRSKTADDDGTETEVCPPDTVHLKRQLGLAHGVGIIAGLVIGGGIYISPKGVLAYAGSPGLSLVLWAIGGGFGLLGALTFAEIGLAIPESGALYAYLRRMFGSLPAFLYAWSYLFFARSGASAIKCLMFARYLLKPFFPDCAIPDVAIKLIATTMACALTVINCFSVKMSARGQSTMTGISVCTLVIISGCGVVWVFQEGAENLQNAFEGSSTDAGDLVLAINTAIFSYGGWTALNFLIEELKNPSRNLPLSIAITVMLTTVLYVFVNFTYIVVLGTDGVLQSEAVATSVALKVLGPFAWLMPLLISITACSSFNSGLMVGSRLAFAGSRRGDLPMVLALISIKYFTPITSLITQCMLVVCYIWTVEVYSLIANAVFLVTVFELPVVAGYIRLRWRQRTAVPQSSNEHTFKLPLIVPILYAVIMVVLVIVPLVTKPRESATGLFLMIATGLPYYLLVFVWKNKPTVLVQKYAQFTNFVQKLMYCVPQETRLVD